MRGITYAFIILAATACSPGCATFGNDGAGYPGLWPAQTLYNAESEKSPPLSPARRLEIATSSAGVCVVTNAVFSAIAFRALFDPYFSLDSLDPFNLGPLPY